MELLLPVCVIHRAVRPTLSSSVAPEWGGGGKGTRRIRTPGCMSRVKLYTLGCNNGDGGGNFSKVKRLVLKSIGTQNPLFSKSR